jgi:hypothetical protein
MTVKNMVGTFARTGVSTATSVVRHPVGSASMAVGLAKGATEAGVYLVRSTITGRFPVQRDPREETVVEESVVVESVIEDPVIEGAAAAQPTTEEAAAPIEPQVVPKPVPAIDELPEPVVIWADDERGEPFHTEPKAASRDSEHGGSYGGREKADAYLEELPEAVADVEPDVDPIVDPVVWTSESGARNE